MRMFCKVFFSVVLSFGLLQLPCDAQEALIDSLFTIHIEKRDTTWVDAAVKASFGAVYSKPSISEESLRSVYAWAESQGYDSRKSRIRLNQGIAKDVINQPDSALYFYSLGLAIAKERSDTAMMAAAYNNIGLIHWNSERLDTALINFRLSEVLFQKVNNRRGLMSTLNNIGLINQSLTKHYESIDYFRRLVQRAQEYDMPYFEAVGHQNIATTYSTMGKADSAYSHLKKAIPIQLENNDLRGLSKSYHTMGQIMSDFERYDEAESFFKDAIEINLKLSNLHALASNYFNLADIYRRTNDREKQFEALKKAYDLRDSYDDEELYNKSVRSYNLMIVKNWNSDVGRELDQVLDAQRIFYNKRLEGRVLELQEAYEAEKKEQEILIKNLQIADQEQAALQQNRLIWGLLIVLALLILFGILFANYRNKLNKLKTRERLVKERGRISRDLHDNIGAQLTAMSTRIDLLEGDTGQSSELEQIRDEAADTVSMLRDTIWAMHREEFTIAQFMTRIRQYASRILPEGLKLELSHDPNLKDDHLNSSEALNLFRIAQEAMQNSLKHSRASTIYIKLNRVAGKYEFTIADDGVGCALENAGGAEHYGLQNIRERTAEINGDVDFDSAENKGFAIRIAF